MSSSSEVVETEYQGKRRLAVPVEYPSGSKLGKIDEE
jgi:hypothetical protein